MHWSSEVNSSFSNAFPWLPLGEDFITRNVELEIQDPKSILNFYKKLIHLKHNNFFLKYGKYVHVENKEKDLFIYKRKTLFGSLTVVLNFSSREIVFPDILVGKKIKLSTYMDIPHGFRVKKGRIIRPFEGIILF